MARFSQARLMGSSGWIPLQSQPRARRHEVSQHNPRKLGATKCRSTTLEIREWRNADFGFVKQKGCAVAEERQQGAPPKTGCVEVAASLPNREHGDD